MLSLALALTAGMTLAQDTGKTSVKSGPQVNEELAGPFHPLNINGSKAGEKNCLYCSNGNNPVAMVFARDTSPALIKLITKLEEACAKNEKAKMGGFVVFCNDSDALEAKLKKVAKDNKLEHIVLSIDNPAGPKDYNVNKDADITVVLYTKRNVKANFAFKKGEMKDADVETVVKSIPKILPQ